MGERVEVLQKDWFEERATCSSFHKISHFHLQLLPPSLVIELCTKLGFLGSSGVSWDELVGVDGSVLTWRDLVSLLTERQLNELDRSCWDHFHDIYQSLRVMSEAGLMDTQSECQNVRTSNLITMEDLNLLPPTILRDFSVLRGAGCYEYGEYEYLYKLDGDLFHGDHQSIARAVLFSRLTRVYFNRTSNLCGKQQSTFGCGGSRLHPAP